MSRNDNIEIDWHDMKEEGGVKYIECEWDSPVPSPANSPRAMQQLAAVLQAAVVVPIEKRALETTPLPPLPSTEISLPPPPTAILSAVPVEVLSAVPVRLQRRRVHGAL